MAQVLTSIELARSARVAANKAPWSGLRAAGGPGCAAASSCSPVLAVDHALVVTAAKDLAGQAALQQATLQVAEPCIDRAFAVHPVFLEDISPRISGWVLQGSEQSIRGVRRWMQQRGGGWRSARGETQRRSS